MVAGVSKYTHFSAPKSGFLSLTAITSSANAEKAMGYRDRFLGKFGFQIDSENDRAKAPAKIR